jgi:DNA-binding transcriptional ArsR family regulator
MGMRSGRSWVLAGGPFSDLVLLWWLAISPEELCVCDIAVVLGMSVSALSRQLRFLRECGAVDRRKVRRIVYHRLVDDHLRDLVLGAAIHVAEGS